MKLPLEETAPVSKIKEWLDEAGVEYKNSFKKIKLLELMNETYDKYVQDQKGDVEDSPYEVIVDLDVDDSDVKKDSKEAVAEPVKEVVEPTPVIPVADEISLEEAPEADEGEVEDAVNFLNKLLGTEKTLDQELEEIAQEQPVEPAQEIAEPALELPEEKAEVLPVVSAAEILESQEAIAEDIQEDSIDIPAAKESELVIDLDSEMNAISDALFNSDSQDASQEVIDSVIELANKKSEVAVDQTTAESNEVVLDSLEENTPNEVVSSLEESNVYNYDHSMAQEILSDIDSSSIQSEYAYSDWMGQSTPTSMEADDSFKLKPASKNIQKNILKKPNTTETKPKKKHTVMGAILSFVIPFALVLGGWLFSQWLAYH